VRELIFAVLANPLAGHVSSSNGQHRRMRAACISYVIACATFPHNMTTFTTFWESLLCFKARV